MAQLIKAVVDTQKNSYKSIGQVNAGDNLELELEVKMNGQPIEFISPECELLAKKSDNNRIRQTKDILYQGGKFKIKVDRQGLTYPGVVTCQLLTKEDGRVSTCLFYFVVGTSLDREILQSISKIETLEQLDEYVVTAFANLDEFEKRILSADETIRNLNDDMIAAEKVRNAAEAKRQENYNTAEASREELYSNSELTRNNNYRNAEADRDRSYSEAEANRNNLFNNCKAEMDAATQNSKNEENRRANTFSNLRTEIQALKTQMEQNESGRVAAEETRVNEFNTMKSENENFKQEINEQYEHIASEFDKAVANVTNGNESATNTEIVLARKGKSTLKDKIDDIDLSLDKLFNKDKLIFSYTHCSNKVIQPVNLDYSTGIWETSKPHMLQTGNKLILDFQRGDKLPFDPRNIVNEIFTFNWTTWYFLIVEVVDDTHFKLKANHDNNYLTYSTSNNINVDFSLFRFQVPSTLKLTNLGLSKYKKLRFVVRYLTMSQGYVNATKVLKLNGTPQAPFYRTSGSKLHSASDLGALLYHNNSYDSNNVYGHAGAYRDDYIVNEITIEENKVTNKSMYSSYGVNKTYTTHDNNVVIRNYSIYKEAEECGYTQGNAFLDDLSIGEDQKFLNGSYIEIYSI